MTTTTTRERLIAREHGLISREHGDRTRPRRCPGIAPSTLARDAPGTRALAAYRRTLRSLDTWGADPERANARRRRSTTDASRPRQSRPRGSRRHGLSGCRSRERPTPSARHCGGTMRRSCSRRRGSRQCGARRVSRRHASALRAADRSPCGLAVPASCPAAARRIPRGASSRTASSRAESVRPRRPAPSGKRSDGTCRS